MKKDLPVYLFVGFLESGKTTFIQETMSDASFDSNENTLLLVCEEGETAYQPEKFAFGGTTICQITDQEALTPQALQKAADDCGAGRVVIEFNGMWQMQTLFEAMPENWSIYQTIATADATTFRMYFDNMRSLMLEKFAAAELLVINHAEKVDNEDDRMYIHKCVRQASRRCDIAYEFSDGSVAYDEIPDELPFDLNAEVVEIGDDDFGVWYLDADENPEKYDKKVVQFTAQVCQTPQVSAGQFVPGRFVMTCCADDIRFLGFPCKFDGAKGLAQRSWVTVKATARVKYHPLYKGKGVVLTALDIQPTMPLENDVVTFN